MEIRIVGVGLAAVEPDVAAAVVTAYVSAVAKGSPSWKLYWRVVEPGQGKMKSGCVPLPPPTVTLPDAKSQILR